jgi:hypothetical protein
MPQQGRQQDLLVAPFDQALLRENQFLRVAPTATLQPQSAPKETASVEQQVAILAVARNQVLEAATLYLTTTPPAGSM